MRGVHTFINDIRRQVFTEVARMAFEGGNYAETIRRLPHKIIPGEVAKYRQNILVERAVVTERIRLAIGLPPRGLREYAPTDAQLEDSVIAEKYYEPPLINIISYACNACPTKQVRVTNMCQGCLAHPCVEVCPKGAVSIVHGKSVIDQSKCVKCGQCANVCPYGAIHKMERPCAKACGMDAIGSDELGRAKIDYDKGILIMDEDEEAQEAKEAKVSFNSDGYITGVSASWNYNEDGDSYKVAVRFHFHTTETVS